MLGALLVGVRRAFPYVAPAEEAQAVAGAHADALFRVLHAAPFGTATQALALLFQLLAARSALSDRFYRCVRMAECVECNFQGFARVVGFCLPCGTQQQVSQCSHPCLFRLGDVTPDDNMLSSGKAECPGKYMDAVVLQPSAKG